MYAELVEDALDLLTAYGPAVEAAVAVPVLAADLAAARTRGVPGPRVPIRVEALDRAADARLVLLAALDLSGAPAGRTRAMGLAALAEHVAETVDAYDSTWAAPVPPGHWATSVADGDAPLAEVLARVASTLPRVAGLPRPSTSSRHVLPAPRHPDARLTIAQAVTVTEALGRPVPAPTLRRWVAEGVVTSELSPAGTRRVRIGDVIDRANAGAGAPSGTVAVDGRQVAAEALRRALGLPSGPAPGTAGQDYAGTLTGQDASSPSDRMDRSEGRG